MATSRGDTKFSVDSRKLNRWLGKGLATSRFRQVTTAERLLGFEDLISLRVIAVLRKAGVSLSDIYDAQNWLQEETGVQRPFATENLWTGQGEVFAAWAEKLVSIGRHGQLALEFLRDQLIPVDDLVFDGTSHVAISWEPLSGIVLEPEVQFGAPCIKGTRIPTRTISGMIEAGDSLEWVAAAFEVSPSEVLAAREWESRLQSA